MIVEWVYKIKMRLRAFIIMQSLRPSAPLWLFFVSVIESSIFRVSVPLGPFTVKTPALTDASTPLGTAMGCFPMRLMLDVSYECRRVRNSYTRPNF